MRFAIWTVCIFFLLGCDDGLGRPLISSFGKMQAPLQRCDVVPTCVDAVEVPPVPPPIDERWFACIRPCLPGQPCVNGSALSEGNNSCKELSVELDEPLRELRRVQVHNSRIDVQTSLPRTLRWHASTLSIVELHLRGPVTLQLDEASQLVGARVLGEANEQGSPTLRMQDATASGIWLEGDLNFEVERAEIVESNLAAQRIHTASSTLAHVIAVASSIELDDTTIYESQLRGSGRLSAATMVSSSLADCETMLVAGTTIKASLLGPCSLLRLYGTTIENSYIDGVVEMDESDLGLTLIGQRSATDLLTFRSSFNQSALCAFTNQLRLSGASFSCASCEGPISAGEADVCKASGERVEVDKVECDALLSVADCQGTFPANTRRPDY